MHVGVSQLDGFQQAGVPELEPWVRQRVEGEVNWLWPLAGEETGLPPCGTARHGTGLGPGAPLPLPAPPCDPARPARHL